VRFIAGRGDRESLWRTTLLEAVGDVMPAVVAFVAFLILIVHVPAIQGARSLQILLLLLLPFLAGWLGFHLPLLSSVAGKTGNRFMLHRGPQVLVTVNMGIGGIGIVAMPLANFSLRICAIFPPSAWTIIIWWVIAAVGSLTGILMVSLYEIWAVKSGSGAWSILAFRQTGAKTPSLRKMWWWIPLSYVALVIGFAIGVAIWQVLA
jgi:hypothetical protein